MTDGTDGSAILLADAILPRPRPLPPLLSTMDRPEFAVIERCRHVMHLSSTVVGQLPADLRAGAGMVAGVVADSEPAAEEAKTRGKAATVRSAIAAAETSPAER